MARDIIAIDRSDLVLIADSVRAKTGKTDLICPLDLASEIASIGSEPSAHFSDISDPIEYYDATRPSDWLVMPTPADNEMYLLFHIPEGVSALVAFTVTCTGNYTVELGTIIDGAFVSQSTTSVESGSVYEAELLSEDYNHLTSSGLNQAMIKISGTDILGWTPSAHNKKTSPASFTAWNIVEIACRLPKATSVECGSSKTYSSLPALKYFAWYGENSLTYSAYMFANCKSLECVLTLDTSKVTNMSNMFANCYTLVSIPKLDTHTVKYMKSMFSGCYSIYSIPLIDTQNVTEMTSMFENCYSLTVIPELGTHKVTTMYRMFSYCYSITDLPVLDTSSVTDMGYMFQCCKSLSTIPLLNTSNVTSMYSMFNYCDVLETIPLIDTNNVENMKTMFYYCTSLVNIPKLNTEKVTDMTNAFYSCYSLSSVKFEPSAVDWTGVDVSFKDASLSYSAIISLFNSLPTITSSKTITLTGNPGAAELTESDKSIATDKGWTIAV